jgi:hypothetical protein
MGVGHDSWDHGLLVHSRLVGCWLYALIRIFLGQVRL